MTFSCTWPSRLLLNIVNIGISGPLISEDQEHTFRMSEITAKGEVYREGQRGDSEEEKEVEGEYRE